MINLFKRPKFIELKAPVKGEVIPLSSVKDDVFAQKMVGDGFAIVPEENIVCAPIGGTINIFPTKHAFIIKTVEGLEILVHIGIDTVELKGEGFKSLINSDKVSSLAEIIEFDMNRVREKSKSEVIPVIITNMEIVEQINVNYGKIEKGMTAATVLLKKI